MPKEVQVLFKCITCEYFNEMELGRKDFIPRQVEYDSVTEIFNHISTEGHNVISYYVVEEN